MIKPMKIVFWSFSFGTMLIIVLVIMLLLLPVSIPSDAVSATDCTENITVNPCHDCPPPGLRWQTPETPRMPQVEPPWKERRE